MPYVLFPRNVRDYAATTFSELKREQSSLLGRRWWHALILRRLYRAPIRTPKTWQDYVEGNRRYFRDAQLDDWPNSLDTSQRDAMYGDAYQRPEGWPEPQP